MKSIDSMSQTELDALVVEADASHGEKMLAAVYDFLGRFVSYPSDHARVAHALWIVHTHLMDKWESTPRLAFLSPEPASGKTRALEVTELLTPNPVSAVNVTPAYLFCKVGTGVTILFDEVDTVFGPKAKENEEIRGLLNAGHRRNAVAGRCVAHGKAVVTEEIPAYAPVALAGLGWLPDTIMSRAVIIRMRRRSKEERVEPFRRRIHLPAGEHVKSMIEAWARTADFEIVAPDKLPPEIQDRDADVWESLITIADAVGGTWPDRARVAAVALVAASKEAEPSLGIRLLADLRTIFGDREAMPSKAILAALHDMTESPWGDIRGKPLDELANRLRHYGVKPKVVRVGESTPRGYARADLYDQWARYLPSLGAKSATSATSATIQVNQPENVADDVADAEDVADEAQHVAGVLRMPTPKNPSKTGAVADVADVAELAGNGGEVCAQCRAGGGVVPRMGQSGELLWLHPECARFWGSPTTSWEGVRAQR